METNNRYSLWRVQDGYLVMMADNITYERGKEMTNSPEWKGWSFTLTRLEPKVALPEYKWTRLDNNPYQSLTYGYWIGECTGMKDAKRIPFSGLVNRYRTAAIWRADR